MSKINLRITGPTPLPDPVREAMRTQMVSHRSGEFRDMMTHLVGDLGELFGSAARVLPFTCSGTGGLEAAIVNTLAPGERAVAASSGYFGDRFVDIARAFGVQVDVVSVPWGQATDPAAVRDTLRKGPAVRGVLLTQNETSTGILNPLEELCRVAREESDALVLVDVVSSLAATDVAMMDWGIDVAIGATQKALMSPPGIALLGVSERVLAARRGAPRYYWDFGRMAASIEDGTTTFTPAISVLYALRAAVAMIKAEGLRQVFARHEALAGWCRDSVEAAGLELFAVPDHRSPTVTAALVPPGLSASTLRDRLEAEHQVLVSSGRGEWKERVLRIGHMGNATVEDVEHLRNALIDVVTHSPMPTFGRRRAW